MSIAAICGVIGALAAVVGTVIAFVGLRHDHRREGRIAKTDSESSQPDGQKALPTAPAKATVSKDSQQSPVRNLPMRNKGFTGRETLLATLRDRINGSDQAAVQVLCGMGGVGKTQLAIEYAHRFASDYDIMWWVNAEQRELIGPQIAALAVELGSAPPRGDTAASVRAVMMELRVRRRWLLIFDNASDAAELRDWLPDGWAGHVLITTRVGGWDEISESIEIDVFDQAESSSMLQARVPRLTAAEANKLANALGNLPLAVAQAARYLHETGIPPGQYLDLLAKRTRKVLGEFQPISYPQSLDAATQLAFERLMNDDPAAATLLTLCAFLAPEPVPARLISGAAAHFPEPLAAKAADPADLWLLLAAISNSALARVGDDSLHMHRLTQAILRDRLPPEQADEARSQSEAIIVSCHPGDRTDPTTWPAWAQILPHLLAADPGSSSNEAILDLTCDTLSQLWRRGDTRGTNELASKMYPQWRDRLGEDDPHTLSAAASLGDVAWDEGRYDDARELDGDVLARRRRILGDDHRDTLTIASSLASDLRGLGRFQEARELQEDTLARRRRVLGVDHIDTFDSARGLAASLRGLGDIRAAHELDEDTFARSTRTLGANHPGTLRSGTALARDLRKLGRLAEARELQVDTLARSRKVLGDNHPDTMLCACELAAILRELGENSAARELAEETCDRSRRILGAEHPDTQQCASELAAIVRQLGDH
jgi:hypothetical protein